MTKRQRVLTVSSVLFVALLAAVWNLSGMPPEDPDPNKGVERTMRGIQDLHTSSYGRWRLEGDVSRRPEAYAAMVLRQVKSRPSYRDGLRWFGFPMQFYDAMAKYGRDSDQHVRAAVAQVLLTSNRISERRNEWLPLVVFWLQDPEQTVVDRAVIIAPLIVDEYDRGGAGIRALAGSSSPRIRLASARALTQILLFDNNPSGGDIMALEHLEKDKDASVRKQASFALGKIGIQPKP